MKNVSLKITNINFNQSAQHEHDDVSVLPLTMAVTYMTAVNVHMDHLELKRQDPQRDLKYQSKLRSMFMHH